MCAPSRGSASSGGCCCGCPPSPRCAVAGVSLLRVGLVSVLVVRKPLDPGRRTDTTHGRGHDLYCTTHTPSCGRDHTTTINYCESRVLDQMPAACLQRQEGSPWLQSATTATQLISKPSHRDGPQPGYQPTQLCAAAHSGRPRPHRTLLQLFRPHERILFP
jgi:hypothetical protein